MISAKQREALAAISQLSAARGIPPTLREIALVLGVSSTNGVAEMVARLEARGLVQREPRVARSLRLTEAGRAALEPEGLS